MARKRDTTPRHPAATSLPGAASSRTDGGPGQPIRVANGQPYGARQALEDQQRAAPLAAGGAQPAGRLSAPPQAQSPGDPREALFAPSGVAGRPNSARITPEDPDVALRVMIARYPHPDLIRLLRDATS